MISNTPTNENEASHERGRRTEGTGFATHNLVAAENLKGNDKGIRGQIIKNAAMENMNSPIV